jgi:hypothetical protein
MRDNSPQMRQKRKLARKHGKRESYVRVLIVCEGKKTEVYYFDDLRQYFRLSMVYCRVVNSPLGTGPEKIVEYAKVCGSEPDRWDEIYCVFDRDNHEHYNSAIQNLIDLQKAKTSKKQAKFMAIPSIPCFELWYLLHYERVSCYLERHEALKRLIRHLPEYEKSLERMFQRLQALNLTITAINNSEMLRQRIKETGNNNPSTEVDLLVKRLFNLKASR